MNNQTCCPEIGSMPAAPVAEKSIQQTAKTLNPEAQRYFVPFTPATDSSEERSLLCEETQELIEQGVQEKLLAPEELLDEAHLFDMDMDYETPGLLGWVDRQARKRLVEIQQAISAAERIKATQPNS